MRPGNRRGLVICLLSLLVPACGQESGDAIEKIALGRSRQAVGGPTVASITLNPSTIAGGSGAASTATVTLSAGAPTGGQVVALSSSNTSLAASVPSITVPPGATSGTFTVATNPLYRRYSGLAFGASISATANGSSASATLSVTAQARPADIDGDSSQRSGTVCGGSFPASQGEAGILFKCSVAASGSSSGRCKFQQECLTFGCQSRQANGFIFSDVCATSGPYPLAVSPSYAISGDHPTITFSLAQAATSGSGSGAQSNNAAATVFPSGGVSVPAGATSATATAASSIEPSLQFVALSGGNTIPVPGSGGGVFLSHRLGRAWLTLAPPSPPPSQVIPTLAEFVLDAMTPEPAGRSFTAEIHMSGVSPSGGPTITLTSSNPAVASIPPSVTIPAGSTGANVTVTTSNSSTTNTVTLTATDGRYTFENQLTVAANTCTPTTCAAKGFNCDTTSDGCGNILDCGICPAPQQCTLNTCRACQPLTCLQQSAVCGTIGDGCGNTLSCGTCPSGQTCTENNCVAGCTPTTCSAQGKNCGSISDGCSGTLNCGTCTAPQTCGGGGVANVCGTASGCPSGKSQVKLSVSGVSGSVTSNPSGLNVSTGATGSACFSNNQQLELDATTNADWSGVTCSRGNTGNNKCQFTVSGAATVTANLKSGR